MSERPQSASEVTAGASAALEFRLLGPVEVRSGGELLPLGGPRQRALLALLCLNRGRVVSVDRIVDELWGDSAPASARHMVEVYVSKLRGLLGPHALTTRSPGYVLQLEPEALDVDRFEGLIADGEEALAAGDPEAAAARFTGGLGLWRGSPLADFTFEPFTQSEIARLEERKLIAEEGRIDAELELGRSMELVSEIERLIEKAPFRERFRAQLMLALYRAGRQADALHAYRQARETLVAELGIEPGQELRDLERAILAQEEGLAGKSRLRTPTGPSSRKIVTMLFVELGARGQGADAEALLVLGRERLAAAEQVLKLHGAAIEQFPDGTLMGVFGTPAAHEDDSLRALRAAVDLREQAIVSRAVVETGEVLVGAAGAVSGPAIRAGTLFLAAAPAGEILVGPGTQLLTAHAARYGAPVAIDESTAWPLRAVTASQAIAPPHIEGPFLGRTQELSDLCDAFARSARDRNPTLRTVVGEPGVGKSRLASVFADQLGGEARVARGRCVAYGKGVTYAPLRDIVRGLAPLADTPEDLSALVKGTDDADAIARRLAGAVGFNDEAYPVEEVRWAARLFVERLARDRPLVLIIEDLHWAESTFLDLLDHIVSVGGNAPIFLLCTARPELLDEHPDWNAPGEYRGSLELERLAFEDAGELASRLDLGSSRVTNDVVSSRDRAVIHSSSSN